MKSIPNTFNQTGLTAVLTKRTGSTALYRLTNYYKDPCGYEIHRIRSRGQALVRFKASGERPERVFVREESERLAGPEDFGVWGWSAFTLEHADRIFELVDSGMSAAELRQVLHSEKFA